MSRAGDLAMVTASNRLTPYLARFDGKTWRDIETNAFCLDIPTSLTRVAVVDPDDSTQVTRLAEALIAAMCSQGHQWDQAKAEEVRSHMRAALVEFANPKSDEPTDPAARVTDRRDNIWRLLADGDWVCTSGPDIGEYIAWARLAAERGPLEVSS